MIPTKQYVGLAAVIPRFFLSEIVKYATRISVCVIAVSKSQEVVLKVRRLLYFFDDDAAVFTSTRRNFFQRRRRGFDFDDESMFFRRRQTLGHI